MAKTASAAVSPSTIATQASSTVTITATNNDSTAFIVGVEPLFYVTGNAGNPGAACAVGDCIPNLTDSKGLSVTGSGGTATVNFLVTPFVPQGPSAANITWVAGANLLWSTGELTVASTANLTVTHQP